MKNKMFTFIVFLLILSGSFSACKDEQKEPVSLTNTSWKLVGIVDTKTNVLTELEPKDCAKCFTLIFDTDSTFLTYTASNDLGGVYIIDYITQSFHITNFGGTKVGEIGGGELYVTPFWNKSILSFSLQQNELKLYYNDGKNYLNFK